MFKLSSSRNPTTARDPGFNGSDSGDDSTPAMKANKHFNAEKDKSQKDATKALGGKKSTFKSD